MSGLPYAFASVLVARPEDHGALRGRANSTLLTSHFTLAGSDMAEWILFLVFGTLAVASALMMVFNRNPVHAALWLVLTFLCVAVLFLILGAQFLAAVQIIVYTGAIMVLFLFVVMLLNLEREQEPLAAGPHRGIAVALAALLLFVLVGAFVSRAGFPMLPSPGRTIGIRDLGMSLYNEWFFPFELASVLLLVAMIGAIVLAKRRI